MQTVDPENVVHNNMTQKEVELLKLVQTTVHPVDSFRLILAEMRTISENQM